MSLQVSEVEAEPPDHCHPDSTEQVALQPSPEVVSPSSQYVEGVLLYTKPSPQISEHESAVEADPPVHVYPVSVRHDELQPSPEVVSPSSQ
jgi:hypothetical protein